MSIAIRLGIGLVFIGIALFLYARRDSQPPPPVTPAHPAVANFRDVILREARGTDSSWGIAHALLAFGPDLELDERSGRPRNAVERLREIHASQGGFRLFQPDGSLGEVHPHLVYKTLTEVVAPTNLVGRREAAPSDDQTSFWDELGAAAASTLSRPASFEEWNDVAWLIEGLARVGSSPQMNLGTDGLTLGDLALGVLEQVEAGDRLVEQALEETGGFRRPPGTGDPGTSGIWAYTCGGQHLLQGLIVACSSGLLPESTRPRVEARIEVFIRRLDGEFRFREAERDRALTAGVARRKAYAETAKAQLKLLGHGLESLARARDGEVGDSVQIEMAAQVARQRLHDVLRLLYEEGIDLAALVPRFRVEDPHNWHLWFGDGCHALRGLAQWP